jgi:hypothetical protein
MSRNIPARIAATGDMNSKDSEYEADVSYISGRRRFWGGIEGCY